MNTVDSVPTVGEADAFLNKYDLAISNDITLRDPCLKILHGLVQLARIYPHDEFLAQPLPEHLREPFTAIQQAIAGKATVNS